MRKIIAITGYARSGKDTLYSLLSTNYKEFNFKRFAFADSLKSDIFDFVWEVFGWDVFELDNEQKRIVRPLLVGFGCSMREMNADYWVKQLEKDIIATKNCYPVITDCRFENEAMFFKKNYDCLLVKVVRTVNGELMPPPNEEEKKQQPLVDKLVDLEIQWETTNDINLLKPYCEEVINLIK